MKVRNSFKIFFFDQQKTPVFTGVSGIMKSLLTCVILGYFFPIHNIPPGTNVIWSAVLIV
jgi:hypothetical protein